MINTTYNVPALLATDSAPTVSTRYNHISTKDIHDILGSMGWNARVGHTVNSRKNVDPLYRKHMLRYTEGGDAIGDNTPEIIVTNSHDGSCSLTLQAGLFRLVCSNGLTVQTEDYGTVRVRHDSELSQNPLDMIDMIAGYGMQVKRSVLIPMMWGDMQMSFEDRMSFYDKAARLRSKHMSEGELIAFDMPQRAEDRGHDLWTVFNRTQEYLVRGGYHATSANGKQRRVRAINAIDSLDTVNSDLFTLANEVALAN